MAAATIFFILNVQEFFESNSSVFAQCTVCLELHDGDKAELLSRI